MAEVRPLYSTCVAVLGFICLVVGATAVGIPLWGYFDSPYAYQGDERGYFSLWKTCKLLHYQRERCIDARTKFRVSVVVWAAGVVAAIEVAALGVFCFFSTIQLAMTTQKKRVLMQYTAAVIAKMAFGLLATLLSIVAAGLFSVQVDSIDNNGFQVTRGPGFYLQILVIVLNGILLTLTIYEVIFARRSDGDPTKATTTTEPTTYGNPGFRERGAGVSMTDASGKPYATGASNGSMTSMATVSTTVASTNGSSTLGSSVTRSPLRSSLKKPKPRDAGGLGIQNPGFSGTSPTLSRNGSTKKVVRIQTQSTEV